MKTLIKGNEFYHGKFQSVASFLGTMRPRSIPGSTADAFGDDRVFGNAVDHGQFVGLGLYLKKGTL